MRLQGTDHGSPDLLSQAIKESMSEKSRLAYQGLRQVMNQGGDREINKDIPSKFFLRPERRD